jgi:hypothetical protein
MENTDSLMADILASYEQQPPGVRAEVEQIAARINEELRAKELALTVPLLRRYFAQVVAFGLARNVSPDQPTQEGHVLGMQLAGVCVLRRQVESRLP